MSSWQETAASVKAEQAAKIPAEWRLTEEEIKRAGDLNGLRLIESKLSARERELTNATGVEILQRIASGELTSLEVTSEHQSEEKLWEIPEIPPQAKANANCLLRLDRGHLSPHRLSAPNYQLLHRAPLRRSLQASCRPRFHLPQERKQAHRSIPRPTHFD